MAITVTNAATTTERLRIKRARKPKLREDVSEAGLRRRRWHEDASPLAEDAQS